MPKRSKPPGFKRSRFLSLEKALIPVSATGGDLKVHLLSPEPYRLAMSGLSFQSVYGAFGTVPGVAIERAFLPEQSGGEWHCLEQGTPLAECDLLSASISFELCYLDLLGALRNAKLLYRSGEERLVDPPP